MPATDPSAFGPYDVLYRVAEGSLGVVYRARHRELDREAAIKELRAEVRDHPAAITGLVAEAASLAALDHPNVVTLYDFVQEADRAWLAEEWVDGVPLDDLLAAHGRLSAEQALGVLTGALSGLAHAHDRDVVHRDVAASNVLASAEGTSMLLDFGLATQSAGVSGTPAYLSPEAASGAPVGKAGDVYSSAALAHHLLAGAPVFGGTPWEMVAAHREQDPPRLEGHGPRLADLLTRSLAKDPAARPPDAGAFLAELEEAATERYGAGWRGRASIAGLVAASLGTGAAVTSLGATGVGAVAPAVSGAAAATVSTGRRLGAKTILGSAVGAGVLVTAVVFGVSAAQDDDPPAAAPPSDEPAVELVDDEPTLSPAEVRESERAEAIADLSASAPSGRYFWTAPAGVFNRRDGGTDPNPGSRGTWTFRPGDCTETACSGRIVSSSGSKWRYRWDGSSMSIDRPAEQVPKAACVDVETGETLPIGESASSYVRTYVVGPVEVAPGDPGEPPAGFSFDYDATVKYRFFGTCEKQGYDILSWSVPLTVTLEKPARRR